MITRSTHIADTFKAAFIDYVLKTFDEDVVIGHEIMYGSCGKIADLVLLYKGLTYAIEIKSDSDSLARIDGQICEYQKQFNYVVVVCGERYVNQLKSKLPKGIGIYQVDNNSIVYEIIKPQCKVRLNKDEMLYSIKTSYLTKIADFPTSNIDADSLRRELTKKRISFVQEILYDYWLMRMTPAFKCFMSDRGSQTIPLDLSNFSSYRVVSTY